MKSYIFEKTEFGYLNPEAEVVIVGITPGNNQLLNSREGLSLREIKRINAFAGNMRPNLTAMLDHIGVNRLLSIASCSSLWEEDFDRVEMTSLLKDATYRVKKNGEKEMFNDTKAIARSAELTELYTKGFVRDCAKYTKAKLFIGCGPDVFDKLQELRESGIIKAEIVGIAHPSGTNGGRIATFLGNRKPKEGEASYLWAQQQGQIRLA